MSDTAFTTLCIVCLFTGLMAGLATMNLPLGIGVASGLFLQIGLVNAACGAITRAIRGEKETTEDGTWKKATE